MQFYTALLYGIVFRCGVTDLKELAKQPTYKALHRVVVYYADQRARHAVATLYDERGHTDKRLEVVYEGFNQHKPFVFTLKAARYEQWITALAQAQFDQLSDQPAPPDKLHSLWLLERAAGSFYKNVLLSPQHTPPPYSILVNAIDGYLPEALREIGV
jgi:hypothetical protein